MNLKISARWLCLFFSLLLGVLPTAKSLAQSSTNITLLSASVDDTEFHNAVSKGGRVVFSSNSVVQLNYTVTISNDVIIDGRVTNVISVTNFNPTNFVSSITNVVVTNFLTNVFVTNAVTNIDVVGGETNTVVTNQVTNITVTNFVTNSVTTTVTNTFTNIVVTLQTNVPSLGSMAGVAGNGEFVLFRVAPNVSAIFDHIQFSNGVSAYGGAISNGGNLICSNAYFANNRAIGRNGRAGSVNGLNGLGGAIFNSSTTALYQCYFVQNSALGGEGAAGPNGASASMFGRPGGAGGNGGFGIGGAIYNDSLGRLIVKETAFNDNLASGGDGNSGGAGGSATFPGPAGDAGFGGAGYGGAIYNRGTNIISQSLFVDNFATGGSSKDQMNNKSGPVGGAALGGALCNNKLMWMDNSTVASNTCVGGKGGGAQVGLLIYGGRGGGAAGGGIYNAGAVKGTYMLALTNCTLAGGAITNGAGGISATGDPKRNGAPGLARGGNLCVTSGTTLLQNTILAYGFPTNSYGVLRDSSHNIVSDRSAAFARSALTVKNLINTDPKLQPLADNGGVTFTMALGSGSPATTNGVDTNIPYDQRGTNRLSPFDVGAFEATGPFNISGRFTFGTNHVITNAFVQVTTTNGDAVLTQTNDAQGNFSFVVDRGSYIFTPHLLDTNLTLNFKPSSVTTNVNGDINNLNFVADSLTVKGTLKNMRGTNLPPGILVTASNSYFGQDFSITNTAKGYVLSGIPNVGTTVIMPKQTNAIFVAQPSAIVSPSNTNINFILIPTYTISATLTPAPKSGLTPDDLGQISVLLKTNTTTTVTNTLSVRGGAFGFSNVIYGTYSLTTDSTNFIFSPEFTKISVISNFTKLKVFVTKRPGQ